MFNFIELETVLIIQSLIFVSFFSEIPCIPPLISHSNITNYHGIFGDHVKGLCHVGFETRAWSDDYDFYFNCSFTGAWIPSVNSVTCISK